MGIGNAMSRRAALGLFASGTAGVVLSACGVWTSGNTAAGTSGPGAAPTSPAAANASGSAPTSAVASGTPAANSAPSPKRGGTLNYGLVGDLSSLEPHLNGTSQSNTFWGVFDRLTAYDLNLRPQPELAESWDVSSDFKTIKLNLRKGVTWHSGREFTSEDVKFNMLRAQSPKVGAGEFANQANWWKSIDAPDKNTLVLTSDLPRPLVFDWFEQFNIVDPQTIPSTAAPQTAVGTGPFTFVEWVQGDHFTLARNQNYWKTGRPYLDGMVVRILRDATAMSVALEAGQLDVMFSPNLQDFVRLKSDSNFQALAHPGNDRGHLIGANVLQPPMDNKLVRQAINYAMDRQRFVNTVLKGVGGPEFLFWNPKSLAYEAGKQNAYQFDLDKAKSLLDQAGVSNLEFDYLVGPTGPGYDFAQLYQGDLAKIGVKLNIKTLQGADFLNMINNRKYTGVYYASASAQAEPASALTYSKAWDPNNNNQGYKDETYTNLITTVATEPDPQKRKALYSQINDIFVDQAFVSAIAVLTIVAVTTSKLQDVTPLAHDAFSYKDAWLNR